MNIHVHVNHWFLTQIVVKLNGFCEYLVRKNVFESGKFRGILFPKLCGKPGGSDVPIIADNRLSLDYC